jgi:hypothetical protein
MRFHSQNLTDSWPSKSKKLKSIFWHGRAWLRQHWSDYRGRGLHCEWMFGKYSTMCSLGIHFGDGDNDDGILFNINIPYVFGFYIGMDNIFKCKGCKTGIGIFDDSIWISPLAWTDEWSRNDPWWRRNHYFSFPWKWDWYKTEILDHDIKNVVWSEQKGDKKSYFDTWDVRNKAKKLVSKTYPYAYKLKNGEIQLRMATVYVERRTWRMEWWWLLPFKLINTTIDVTFDGEVGERTGSWKGGCLSCSYDLFPNETPEQCLRRMEQERKFK